MTILFFIHVNEICLIFANRMLPINEHLHTAITIADLAEQSQLSEYHFAHMFKQSTGVSPHQYVLQQRLERAQHLVLHHSCDLTKIALQCGFSSASHFSTRFKHHYGYSPSVLRKLDH